MSLWRPAEYGGVCSDQINSLPVPAPSQRNGRWFWVVQVLYEYWMKERVQRNWTEKSDEEKRFSFPLCLTDDLQFCLQTPIKSIYFGSAGVGTCMFACSDFHAQLYSLKDASVCACFVHECVLCVFVCVMPQMYRLQQVSLWHECIIQAQCAGAASDTIFQVSFFSPSCTLTTLMLLTWKNQNLTIQCTVQQSAFFLSFLLHTFSVSSASAGELFANSQRKIAAKIEQPSRWARKPIPFDF